MSTTWFIAKEYLKRLEIGFEERGKKTFSLSPPSSTRVSEIEVAPGTDWITLTTRLFDTSTLPEEKRVLLQETLLRTNATRTEANFGLDKRGCVVLNNAIPVTGISYDAFSAVYEAHLTAIKLFHTRILPMFQDIEK